MGVRLRGDAAALVPSALVIAAELEIFHSRPIAPTRRIALGVAHLPVDPAPGAGGLLLAAIVGRHARAVEGDLREDLVWLIEDLDAGRRIPQPRVKHRFQTDRVGLSRAVHQLHSIDGELRFEFDDEGGKPVQQILGAVYAAGRFAPEFRTPIFDAIRNALVWPGEVDDRFISEVMGGRAPTAAALMAWNDPTAWALDIFGFDAEERDVSKRNVQKRFRTLLREAHPDHGNDDDEAAQRINDLTEARRILLATT